MPYSKQLFENILNLKNLYFGKGKNRFKHYGIGSNQRFTNLQASIGLAQLERINQIIKKKNFIGNYYNDVNIPNKYYTKIQFENFLQGLNLKIQDKITNERYHPKIFMFLSNPRFHFIYLIS